MLRGHFQVCHKHGVIHRDLKPENFLYANATENTQLKAIGFGLSIFFEPGHRFGEIVGSPYYMAPKVLRRNYGQEVDVWSASVILLHFIMWCSPFLGSTETEEGIAHAIVKGTIDFNRYPWPRVSDEAKDLLKGMLDANPYNRFTVEEVLEGVWIAKVDILRGKFWFKFGEFHLSCKDLTWFETGCSPQVVLILGD
ncbi:calcium-dependent protein kinase 24-like isoform X1 [Capsicum annuum]|uniref:calcium-dependent protein kinase 24-like isoform X1 n=1 Tax=Capsicum annuum TaxID=4072 RepID=UPI001FB19CD3|nr:calcium-dependent protein kinase 24-like isoform X1 [Capsicum annuum]XP_047263149.1 calcium-dependent protein kinase 24-like isoform X1 [Capsicum annuum]